MSLRSKVMLGSIYLVLREGLGTIISVGNLLLITHFIGPTQYGVFTSAYGLCLFLQKMGHLGVGIYLIRQEGEQTRKDYYQAFTLLLLLGTAFVTIALLSLPLLQGWLKIEGFAPLFEILALFSFLTILSQVPLAKLERDLEFKSVAWIELLGQLLMFAISLPLALKGFGAWSPAIGWCATQVQTIVLLFFRTRLCPKLYWDWHRVREMLSYGFSVSASSWVWDLRNLVNPLIVARFAGPEAVGQIALAIRMLDVLSFAKNATYRISISALARIQDDPSRLKKAVSEGMELQILVLGPLLVFVSWIGPIMFPILFGPKWTPVMTVFPFIAIAYLSNAAFNLHCSVLYVLRRNWEVTAFHVVYIALFVGFAYFLVPQVGMIGYGWAEPIAIVSYGIVHFYVDRVVGSPNYQIAALWWVALNLALFSHQIGWWVAGVLVLVILLPSTRDRITHYFKSLRSMKAG